VISLDDSAAFASLDKGGMLALLDKFPSQCREGRDLGARWAEAAGAATPEAMVVAGMGGSAMAGDLVRGLTASELAIPLVVVRDYDLPAWVGPSTVVVCSSYSGNTEETLSAFRAALDAGARVLAVSSGGELAAEAEKRGIPCLTLPGGLPPRAALGYSFFGLLSLLEGWGLLGSLAEDAGEALEALDAMRGEIGPVVPERENEAKRLARTLSRALPVLCAPEGHLAAVTFRWRTQLNENAKMAAYNCLFPELDHNEIVGWAAPFNVDRPVAVFMRDSWESGRNRKRIEITREIMEKAGVPVREAWGRGSRMTSAVCLSYLGDYVSVYAAFLRGVDPTPVEAIEELKRKMKEDRED